MTRAPSRTSASMFRGVTNICPSASPPKSPASMTVGIPSVSTGTPSEARLSSGRSLPTPEPGACRLRFAGTPDWLPARLLAPRETPGSQSVLLFRLSRGGDYLSLRRCEAELYNPS